MKSITVTLCVVATLLASACALQRPGIGRPDGNEPDKLIQWGIASYNSGNIDEAKTTMEKVLELTKGKNLPRFGAEANFYLAAVAWDYGKTRVTDHHLRECLSIQQDYQPDWTFCSPGLRKRFEALAADKK